MDESTKTVVGVLSDGYGLPEESIYGAMKSDESVRDRIERIAEGDGEGVDTHILHTDVKLVLMGEEV